ncbi:MAG: aminotransferase class V-fold PLP-dependent enzyme [Anaerolineae bacterium]|nr:aminotransferase class V-fold PLP-dependent enzyme [Anaerolineae bacterium]
MYDIQLLREQEFPLSSEVIYFNHASISPLPTRTRQKMQWSAEQLAAHPMRHFGRDGLPMFEAFNKTIATYINAAHPHEIVVVPSTVFGINSVAQAIQWQQGDNILFCDTEFPSNAYPWMSLARDGVEVRLVPSVNGGLTLDALVPMVDQNTRLVAASAIQFFSGHRTDLEKIGAFCRERGLLFAVDAIQAAGHFPIDVQAMNIDILASGGQKSLMGPPGVGFLYVRDEVCAAMQPRFIGSNATQNYLFWLDYDMTPLDGAARFMNGTTNVVGMFGLLESLTLLRELGLENIDQHTTTLAVEAIERMTQMGYEVVTAREEHGPIVTFKSGLESAETDALVEQFNQQNISVVKHLDKKGMPHLRLSFHCYNTKDELDQFAAILKETKR